MPNKSSESHLPRLAVYSRNHKVHLEAAALVAFTQPDEQVVLRSRKKWVSAARAVRLQGATRIYFAVVDGGPLVEYEAKLIEVQLDPALQDPTTERLLAQVADSTREEGLWQAEVRTLYAIRGCRRLSQPFPLHGLVKHSNGEPLSDGYTRSYALVLELPPAAV